MAVALEDYDALRTPSALTLSPDGRRLVFRLREADRDEDEMRHTLWIVPTDGSDDPYRLTRASDARSPRFSPDGSRLGFIAAREEDVSLAVAGDQNQDEETDTNGDDEPKPQLWVFDLERGGDARQLTTFDHGVSDFDWGPAGDRVVVAARDPTDEEGETLEQRKEGGPIETERLQHKYDGAGWLDTVRTYLFVVDCADRSSTRLDAAHDGGGLVTEAGGLQPRWAPDGSRVVFRSNRTDDPDDTQIADLYTISPDGTGLERLTDGTRAITSPRWSPDGTRVAYSARDSDNWYVPAECYVTDFETHWSVTGELDRTLMRTGPRWLDDETLLVGIGDRGQSRLALAEADGSGCHRAFDVQGRDRGLQGYAHADGVLATILSHPEDGVDCFVAPASALEVTGEEATLERVTALNDDLLESWPDHSCARVTYESDDGTEIEAIAYFPPESDPETPVEQPLVVSIHGGPMSFDQPQFSFQDRVFTSRGYVVLKPNYRGSTSYGRDFCEALRGRWNSIEVEDILAAVETAIDRGWADPDRLYCTGFSQGGVNTAFAITKTDQFIAAAAEHGIYDMSAAFGTDDSHNWWESDYGLPWENPEGYASASSIDDVADIETPLLLTAGEHDWRCPPSQSEQLYVSLKKRGVPSKLVVYQDEHHNVGDPERAIHRFEELLRWFERFDPVATEDPEETNSSETGAET